MQRNSLFKPELVLTLKKPIVILPYPTDTDEGQRKNRKWVADNNKVAKKLGTEVEENGDEQSGDEERESVSRE